MYSRKRLEYTYTGLRLASSPDGTKKTRENAAAARCTAAVQHAVVLYPSKVVIRSLPRFVMVFHQDCHRRPLENGPVMAGFYTQIFTILWAGCDLARCNISPAVRQHQENACTLSLTKGERRLVGRDARRRDWIKVVVSYLFSAFFHYTYRSTSSSQSLCLKFGTKIFIVTLNFGKWIEPYVSDKEKCTLKN